DPLDRGRGDHGEKVREVDPGSDPDMATVEVCRTPQPAHVRPAGLVVTAVARRSGVAESLLDEVRLAVGEACSRAVEENRRSSPGEPVRIALTDQPGRFEVEVSGTGTASAGR